MRPPWNVLKNQNHNWLAGKLGQVTEPEWSDVNKNVSVWRLGQGWFKVHKLPHLMVTFEDIGCLQSVVSVHCTTQASWVTKFNHCVYDDERCIIQHPTTHFTYNLMGCMAMNYHGVMVVYLI